MLKREMSNSTLAAPQAELIERFLGLREDSARSNFLRENPALKQERAVRYLTDRVVTIMQHDSDLALQWAEAASWLAGVLQDDDCRAKSARAVGDCLFLKGQYRDALNSYQRALDLFRRLKQDVEAAVTLSRSIHPLIYLGDLEEASRRAEAAREAFRRRRDHLRLARLDADVGNALYRQDYYHNALTLYRHALPVLESLGEQRDTATVLNAMAACYLGLQDFKSALEAYQRVRAYSEQHKMPELVAEADYYRAHLHYLRGEYGVAINLYRGSREIWERLGDAFHSSLCLLEQSEIDLDLNLMEEAAKLAKQALASFEELKRRHQAAKALTILAIATHGQDRPLEALEILGRARQLFAAENDSLWTATLDLYLALGFYHTGQTKEALQSVEEAHGVLSHFGLEGKAAQAELLRASLHLQAGDFVTARSWCNSALERVERAEITGPRYLIHFVLGQEREAQNEMVEAHECYSRALHALENLPTLHQAQERIPLFKDTWPLYEALLGTTMRSNEPAARQATFEVVEKAKSRMLAELFSFPVPGTLGLTGVPVERIEQIYDLRRELDAYCRQLCRSELDKERQSVRGLKRLRELIRENESRLLRAANELGATNPDFSFLQGVGTIPPQDLLGALPRGSTLLDYFEVRGSLRACVLNRRGLEIIPLAASADARGILRALREHFAKVQESAGSPGQTTGDRSVAQVLLQELYSALFAPLREHIDGQRLIIVPHGFLHYVPFQALHDGSKSLIEEFTISHSLSARLYLLLCGVKKQLLDDTSVVMSVSEPEKPHDECAMMIAAALPNARLLVGDEATEALLKYHGRSSHNIYLETRAVFRRDNPLFSTLSLRGSLLRLFDLYQSHLPCGLVTLNGCGPALEEMGEGEELIALVGGFHYAGARGVLTSLWTVPELSAVEILGSFYSQSKRVSDKAEALRQGMLDFRTTYPHPYHWASFTLWGSTH